MPTTVNYFIFFPIHHKYRHQNNGIASPPRLPLVVLPHPSLFRHICRYQSLISGRLRLSIIVAQFDNPNDGNKNKSPHTLLPSPGLPSSSILYPSASTDSWLMVVGLSLISSHLWRPVYHSISLVGPFSFSAHHTQRNQQWQEQIRCCTPATDP